MRPTVDLKGDAMGSKDYGQGRYGEGKGRGSPSLRHTVDLSCDEMGARINGKVKRDEKNKNNKRPSARSILRLVVTKPPDHVKGKHTTNAECSGHATCQMSVLATNRNVRTITETHDMYVHAQEELRATRERLADASRELKSLRRSRDHNSGAVDEARRLRERLDRAETVGAETSTRAAAAESLAEEERYVPGTPGPWCGRGSICLA